MALKHICIPLVSFFGNSPWLHGAYSPGIGEVITSVIRAVQKVQGVIRAYKRLNIVNLGELL